LTEGAGNGFGISVEADVIATGNIIENCAYAGLKLGFGPYLRNVTASANTIRRSPYGILVSVAPGAGRAAIIDNRIEGATRVPAFLVHDSPREADLGLLIYHRLFQLARWLEGVGGQPLFQYVLTTTTRPPPDLAKEPWLRLSLRGAPAAKRLLQCDL